MEKSKAKDSILGSRPDAEKVVAENYGQLLEWAKLLTRGDIPKAQDIVQDLYLHFALAKPDLSNIKKLDGYLYISLKHLYLSMLARASREAMRVVSLEDFDSVEFAVEMHREGDLLQRQNELRRLCFYSVWRKEQSKSFCYFILHFFHGYYRHEIADLARVPMAAIYNKLKAARAEVKSYLQSSGKIHVAGTDSAPEPVLVWSPVSAPELFSELRGYILSACLSECLPESELLSYYKEDATAAIPRELLAHIVSCEHCLAILDNRSGRPSLKEREALDAIGYFGENRNMESRREKDHVTETTLRILRHRSRQFFEHRPRILSIAVNGSVVAFQEIFSQRSVLTARTEEIRETSFVEVFTEQGVRLAFLSILDFPPDGPHEQSQTVPLSDGRWLRLSLSFDGQGLSSEVTYFDPVLGFLAEPEEDEEEGYQAQAISAPLLSSKEELPLGDRLVEIARRFGRLFAPFAPVQAVAWSLLLFVGLSTAGYLVYRQIEQPMSAVQALNRSVQVTASELRGQTEHQVLHFEERSSEGKLLQQGSIDLWKDGDGVRSLRRLYNTDHHLVAAEWQLRSGEKKSYLKAESKQDQNLVEDNLWRNDVSPGSFIPAQHQSMQLRKTPQGYEISISGAVTGNPQVISATLVLNRQWHFVRQVMLIRRNDKTYEARYELVSDERKPMHSIPDSFFVPETKELGSALDNNKSKSSLISSNGQATLKGLPRPDLAQLELSSLYEMFRLGSDSSDPIEIVRTPEGRLQVVGAVTQNLRKQELVARFSALPNHEFLDVRISSPSDGAAALSRSRRSPQQQLEVYDVGQKTPLADRVLRRILAKKLSGDALNSVVIGFSREALDHAQFALQEANALHRLGQAWSPEELRSMPLQSQQLWVEMIVKHASALESQMDDLSEQLDQLSHKQIIAPVKQAQVKQINNLEDFSLLTDSLLQQTQSIHRKVGKLFASNANTDDLDDPEALIAQVRASVPRQQIEALLGFAHRMKQ